MTKRLPDFIIGGTEKGGTTWLHDLLSRHPDVFLPDTKELHFFNGFDSNHKALTSYETRGLDGYAQHFTRAQADQLVGEATPLYLSDRDAADRIARDIPDVRMIFLLREPVSRTWSHYRMAVAKQHVDLPIETIVRRRDARFLERGLYARHLTRWFDLVGRARCLVLFYEDVARDPEQVLRDVAAWLDLDANPLLAANPHQYRNAASGYRSAGFYNMAVKTSRSLRQVPIARDMVRALKSAGVYNVIKAANRRPPPELDMPSEIRAKLHDYFAEDVARLPGLIAATPPWSTFFPETAVECTVIAEGAAPSDPAQHQGQVAG